MIFFNFLKVNTYTFCIVTKLYMSIQLFSSAYREIFIFFFCGIMATKLEFLRQNLLSRRREFDLDLLPLLWIWKICRKTLCPEKITAHDCVISLQRKENPYPKYMQAKRDESIVQTSQNQPEFEDSVV